MCILFHAWGKWIETRIEVSYRNCLDLKLFEKHEEIGQIRDCEACGKRQVRRVIAR